MYHRIMVGMDGSECSSHAAHVALALAERSPECLLLGCHVYAAQMHKVRFQEMEPGLPDNYQDEERLNYLRGAHEGIISDGMKLISESYLKTLEEEAVRRRISYRSETPEGRNYVQLLRVARELGPDLLVLGAHGLGKVPEVEMGSLTERTMLGRTSGDVLVARSRWSSRGPIVAGVDGSPESFLALERAFDIGAAFQAPVWAVAVYDPFFHGGVFKSVSGVLSEEGRQSFDFAAQEKLHDEIIDRGLETLYHNGLEKGEKMARERGVELRTEVLMGKVAPQIHHFADVHNARLVVMGRWGLHREEGTPIGSNTMNLARMAHTNVLIVGAPSPGTTPSPPLPAAMSTEGGPSRLADGTAPPAEVVVLKKTKRLAPEFHRHIVQGRLQGQDVAVGDKVLVYEVQATVPEGRVTVGPSTRLEFR